MTHISFPNLNLNDLSINRILIPFGAGGRGIHWYAIIIVLGMVLATIYSMIQFKKHSLKSDDALDILLFCAPMAIIGARLYYVIFSSDVPFKDVYKIWDGGLAIYGGIIFAIITGYFVIKFKKINLPKVFDIGFIGIMIGQAVGRWGNFVNGEAYGSKTNLPWGMIVNGGTGGDTLVPVHPTFLYESLWLLLGVVILHIYHNRKKFNGELFLLALTWYGVGRALIEQLRDDSLYLGNFRVSQILSIILAAAAFITWIYLRFFKKLTFATQKAYPEAIDTNDDSDYDEDDNNIDVEVFEVAEKDDDSDVDISKYLNADADDDNNL